jgi:hypothetical protein
LVPDKKYDVNCFEEENIYLDEKICHHVVSIIALILIILIKIKIVTHSKLAGQRALRLQKKH